VGKLRDDPRPGPICFRLPDRLYGMLEEFLERHGLTRSEGMRAIVEEWLALERYRSLEFRDGPFGRRAAVRDGPEVWEVISVREASGEGPNAVYAHFSWLDREVVDEALDYHRWNPGPIDRLVAERRRLARLAEAERPSTEREP